VATGTSEFKVGDKVRTVPWEGTVTFVGFNVVEVEDDRGGRNRLAPHKVERVIPEAPPKGSLVLIDSVTKWLRGSNGKFGLVYSDGSVGHTFPYDEKDWEDVYRPGYKVATFA
jgi:hypothetical protein